MSGKGEATCDKLQKAAAHKVPVETLEILNEIIAIRRGEEEVETRCDHGVYQAYDPYGCTKFLRWRYGYPRHRRRRKSRTRPSFRLGER
jgi:hypothetical protein